MAKEKRKKQELTFPDSKFDGGIFGYAGIILLSVFLNLITLGILVPYTVCLQERWVCRHTLYGGKRLTFDGKAMQYFGQWMLSLLLILITAGIYLFFATLRIEKWKAKHTHFEGGKGESVLRAGKLGWFGRLLGCFFLVLLTLGFAIPYAYCVMHRYILNHTKIDGKPMEFLGHALGLFGKYLLWALFSLVTLGIYGWFVPVRLKRWTVIHTRIQG